MGLVALLRGWLDAQALQLALGFLLVAIGICVKHEGLVWLMLALCCTAIV